ncbi:unnamed protein product [Cunninghamella blakesleeana]
MKYINILQRHIHNKAHKLSLYGWGNSNALPLKQTVENIIQPVLLNEHKQYIIPSDETINNISTGWGHSLISTNKYIYGFGLNRSHQIGVPDEKSRILQIDSESATVQKLVCGREHSHIVLRGNENQKDRLYSIGNNMYGQLGLGKSKVTNPGLFVTQNHPKQVHGYDGSQITDIVCGLDNTVFSTDENKIYAMGWGADGQLGQGNNSSIDKNIPSCLPLKGDILKLSSSTDFTMALEREGQLWVWGNSEYGQGIQGAKIDRILEPVPINIDKKIVDMAAGGPFSVILTDDGKVYTCGYGSLGLGTDMIETLEIKQVKELKNIIKVFAATDYAAALSESGVLFTWGLNGASGRLGLGHCQHEFTPKQIKLEKAVIDVSLGTNHALALCL